jgi:hypothetical protein
MRTYIKDPSSSGNVLEISRTTGIYGERNEYDVTGQYRIDRPDLWIENEMITFPNGVKGFRATAAYSTGNANTGVTYLLANNSHGFGSFSRIINYGGTSGNIGGDNNY